MTVQRNGGPDVGVPVVFQAADGTVIATIITHANGVATATVSQGGIVSVIQTMPDVISTYIGVSPPEQITLVDYTAAQPIQTVAVTYPTQAAA
jgi:hypothetical protein